MHMPVGSLHVHYSPATVASFSSSKTSVPSVCMCLLSRTPPYLSAPPQFLLPILPNSLKGASLQGRARPVPTLLSLTSQPKQDCHLGPGNSLVWSLAWALQDVSHIDQILEASTSPPKDISKTSPNDLEGEVIPGRDSLGYSHWKCLPYLQSAGPGALICACICII